MKETTRELIAEFRRRHGQLGAVRDRKRRFSRGAAALRGRGAVVLRRYRQNFGRGRLVASVLAEGRVSAGTTGTPADFYDHKI